MWASKKKKKKLHAEAFYILSWFPDRVRMIIDLAICIYFFRKRRIQSYSTFCTSITRNSATKLKPVLVTKSGLKMFSISVLFIFSAFNIFSKKKIYTRGGILYILLI